MIRSCSEAICETVGSIMNQHAGKNRHLDPRYFSMEIYLRFNFGPMHLMKDLIKYYLIKIAKVTSEKERLPTNLLLKISTRILLLQTMKKIVKKSHSIPTLSGISAPRNLSSHFTNHSTVYYEHCHSCLPVICLISPIKIEIKVSEKFLAFFSGFRIVFRFSKIFHPCLNEIWSYCQVT